MKLWMTLLVLLAACGQAGAPAAATGITNYPKLNTPQYWQNLSPENDRIVMNPKEIEQFNRKIIEKSPSVCDLANDSPPSGPALKNMIDRTELLNEVLYVDGTGMTWQYKQNIRREMNVKAIGQSPVQYGVTVRRSNLRNLPSADGWFSSAYDTNFDQLQETAVDPSEPAVILHASASGKFSYVQTRNYRGWMQSRDLAVTDRKTWLNYVRPADFLIVAANRYNLPLPSLREAQLYQMGAKILLRGDTGDAYLAVAPFRAADGSLTEITVKAPKSDDLHRGYLPYTRGQIIAQSFRFLRDPYGWGGLKNSVDCSSFIADIYRSVGVELPRNADEQELTAGLRFPMQNLNTEARRGLIAERLKAGDALFFDGHVMLYLGRSNDTPFVIHSLGSHTKHNGGAKEKIATMQVVVSDLSLRRYSGVSFIDALTGAVSYRQ